MSERMACRLAGLSRSAYRRPLKGDTVADPDRALRDWLRAWAKSHPRYGYRRALKRPGFRSESQQGESEYAQEVQSRAA